MLFNILGKIEPGRKGKPAPSRRTVTTGFKILFEYGEFTYDERDGFKITRRDRVRLETWLDDAVRAGRLTTGIWDQKAWIGFSTLSRMTQAFIQHFHDFGCWNWDVVISKCLSVVLIASLSARGGDVTHSQGYCASEYMRWEHIELTCEGDAKMSNIRVAITLAYVKGRKNTLNRDDIKYLRPLNDVVDAHVSGSSTAHSCPS